MLVLVGMQLITHHRFSCLCYPFVRPSLLPLILVSPSSVLVALGFCFWRVAVGPRWWQQSREALRVISAEFAFGAPEDQKRRSRWRICSAVLLNWCEYLRFPTLFFCAILNNAQNTT